jgi:hypothetical protein
LPQLLARRCSRQPDLAADNVVARPQCLVISKILTWKGWYLRCHEGVSSFYWKYLVLFFN